MDRLIHTLAIGIQRSRRQHTDRTGQHRGNIREDIAEHVGGNHHIELPGRAHQLHGGIVDIHVTQLDIRIVLCNTQHDLAPQFGHFQHVGLVHRAQALAALARNLERRTADALDLRLAVHQRVETFLLAIVQRAHATWLAKVNTTGQLAHDHDVQAGHHFRFQRGSFRQLRIQNGRAQVREQFKFGTQAQQTLLRPQWAIQRLILRTADRAQQNRICRARLIQRIFRQRMACGIVGRAADQPFFQFNIQATGLQRMQNFYRFGDNLRANAVTG